MLNDGFLKVFDHIDQFDNKLPFLPWFRKIIVNAAIDHYKSNRTYYAHKDSYSVEVEITDPQNLNECDVNDLMNLLNELPEMYRLVFNLYEIEGYSHQEISDALRIGVSTSRSNLTRAKKLLRLKYKQIYEVEYERSIR